MVKCFDRSSLSEEEIALCEESGVKKLMVENILNTFTGVEFHIRVPFTRKLDMELFHKIMKVSSVNKMFNLTFIYADTGEVMIPKEYSMEFDLDSLCRLKIVVIPPDTRSFKIKINPTSFKLFDGILDKFSKELHQPGRRILSHGIAVVSSDTRNELFSNFNPSELL